MLLIDVINGNVDVVNTSGLSDYYEYLNCDCIDITRRRVEDRYFEIICDDCGLLKSDSIVSALDNSHNVMLVGNLLIAGGDVIDGDLTSITDDDVKIIKKHIREMIDLRAGTVHPIVFGMAY